MSKLCHHYEHMSRKFKLTSAKIVILKGKSWQEQRVAEL